MSGLFNYSPTEGHFSCFWFCVIISDVAINNHASVFYVGISFHYFGGKFPGIQLLGHIVCICSIFKQNVSLFLQSGHAILHSKNIRMYVFFILAAFGIVTVLKF
jgi:hypothetical protein